MKIILGSSSKFRQQILTEMGYDFEVISPDIDEKKIRDVDPKKLVLALAHAKAEAILKKIQEPAVIITADQVVTFKGEIREKPSSPEQVREFLESYGNNMSETVNGIVVTNTVNKKQESAYDTVQVFLHDIPSHVIDQLIEEGVIFHCAGALRLEDPLMVPFIKEIRGSQDSLMGLPKNLTKSLMQKVWK